MKMIMHNTEAIIQLWNTYLKMIITFKKGKNSSFPVDDNREKWSLHPLAV